MFKKYILENNYRLPEFLDDIDKPMTTPISDEAITKINEIYTYPLGRPMERILGNIPLKKDSDYSVLPVLPINNKANVLVDVKFIGF